MKPAVIFTLALGLGVVSAPALASEMQDRFREEGQQIDLTRFLQSDNDVRSDSFLYGRVHQHDFTVEKDGTYTFASHVSGGESEDYRVAATLLDDSGKVVARGKGLGNAGGLELTQQLAKGDYTLRVEGHKFGSSGNAGGNSFFVTVEGTDVDGGVSRGDGIAFVGNRREGGKTAFVRRSSAVAAVAPPSSGSPQKQAEAPAAASAEPEADAAPPATEKPSESDPAPANSADRKDTASQQQSFEEVVTDVKIRASGEVMTFKVLEKGTVAVTTSTFSGNEGTYRIEAEILDSEGNVVARDAGEGFDGDVDLRSELEPGEYRVRVKGQKFGGAGSGVNNYELKVQQLD
ncbi:hypothetical protein [Vreelandella jeotgali]|uniref:hypothetical protein n=1 Tax=Vreelandella jeotgali TaxID=553386 RepID=UPI00034AB7E7|nr:hypothetical protein [Halomonas jeotgali]